MSIHMKQADIYSHMYNYFEYIKKNIVYIFFAAQILHSVLEKINYFFNKMGKKLENFFNIQLMPFVFIILRKKHKTNAILLLN